MILYATPYSSDKKILSSYDNIFKLLGSDDWACITDGDAMFTTRTFGHQMEDIVNKHGDKYGVFTCMTNRVANNTQLTGDWNDDSLHSNRKHGETLLESLYDDVEDITEGNLLSGVMIMMQRKTWEMMLPMLKQSQRKMLGVDNDIHLAARQLKVGVGLLRGVYLFHYYRNGNKYDKSHLE